MLVHRIPSHMVCDTLWHYHTLFVWCSGNREKAKATGSFTENQCIFLMLGLQIFTFLRSFFSSLMILLSYRSILNRHEFLDFHNSIHILLIRSHWQFLPSNNPELNTVLPMYPCDIQKADLFSDLESLTQFYYCSPSWHLLLLSVVFPVTVYWPFRHFHMNQY